MHMVFTLCVNVISTFMFWCIHSILFSLALRRHQCIFKNFLWKVHWRKNPFFISKHRETAKDLIWIKWILKSSCKSIPRVHLISCFIHSRLHRHLLGVVFHLPSWGVLVSPWECVSEFEIYSMSLWMISSRPLLTVQISILERFNSIHTTTNFISNNLSTK